MSDISRILSLIRIIPAIVFILAGSFITTFGIYSLIRYKIVGINVGILLVLLGIACVSIGFFIGGFI